MTLPHPKAIIESDFHNSLKGLITTFIAQHYFPTLAVIDCGPLEPPANGVVQFERTVFGSVAQYQCNRGFRLKGSDVRTCQANSQWSGRQPACIGWSYLRLYHSVGGASQKEPDTVRF